MTDPLSTWNDGAAKDAILRYVDQTCSDGSAGWVPAEERVAVFDNDGTLWCEKPMPIQLDFILRRLVEMAQADPDLRDRQPWKAAHERDYSWLAQVMADHYAGDDTNLPVLGFATCIASGGGRDFMRPISHESRRCVSPCCTTTPSASVLTSAVGVATSYVGKRCQLTATSGRPGPAHSTEPGVDTARSARRECST